MTRLEHQRHRVIDTGIGVENYLVHDGWALMLIAYGTALACM
jgi:hypothetical protein